MVGKECGILLIHTQTLKLTKFGYVFFNTMYIATYLLACSPVENAVYDMDIRKLTNSRKSSWNRTPEVIESGSAEGWTTILEIVAETAEKRTVKR